MACASVAGAFGLIAAYSSVEPLIVGLLLFVAGALVLSVSRYEVPERAAFRLMFSVCWFWSGVSAVLWKLFDDPSQGQDALWFFLLASRDTSDGGLLDIGQISEGAGAIVVWRLFYAVFGGLGFALEPHIGISLNVLLIALTAAIGVRTVRVLFPHDQARMGRFTTIISCCGLFWLFGSIHLRDASIVIIMALLGLAWVSCLQTFRLTSLVRAIVVNIVSSAFVGLLRQELLFVPLGMLTAGLVATAVETMSISRRRVFTSVLVLLAIPVVGYGFLAFQSDIAEALAARNQYADAVATEHANDSLGKRFVTNAPGPVRAVLGSMYLFVFPIPFWVGFQDLRIYTLLKSFQALFMYGLTPLVVLAGWRVLRIKTTRTAPMIFLVLVSLGLVIAVALTSVETRHFGMALVPMMVLSTLPDLRGARDSRAYRNLLALCIGAMALVHFLWALVKYS